MKYSMLVILLKKPWLYKTQINKIEKKITDHIHDKYIATPEFNKFTAEISQLILKREYLASKNDIGNFV